MRDPARIDRILGKLRKVWYSAPDQRLAQLVFNCIDSQGRGRDENGRPTDTFYIEDDVVESGLDAFTN